jgi:hypothetical protein
VDRHVDRNKGLDSRSPQAESSKGAWQRGNAESSDRYDFVRRDCIPSYDESATRTDAGPWRRNDLDWAGGFDIQTEQPGGCVAGEDHVVGKQTAPCREC